MFLAFSFMLLAPVLDAAAQGFQITADPTGTPSPTPTETFEPPLQANPTEAPATEDVPPQETEIDTIVQVTEEPVEPEDGFTNTITVHKSMCNDPTIDFHSPEFTSNIENYSIPEVCGSAPDGFEFTVSDGEDFSQTAMTSGSSVQFNVPTGVFSVTETVPAGWAEPVAYCWSNLVASADGAAKIGNSINWKIAEGEHAECLFVNIADPDDQSLHTIRVDKFECPEGFDPTSDWFTYQAECTTAMPDVDFTLELEESTSTKTTDANGKIEWNNVFLGGAGQIGINEDIPAGYGEPVVWCVSFPEAAADPEDFDIYQVPATDGRVLVTPEQHSPFIFSCTYFNFAETDGVEGGNTVTIIKKDCPYDAGAITLDQYSNECPTDFDGIDFTLTYDGNALPATTSGGMVEWTGVPAGDFSIQETIPAGYGDPVVFCSYNLVPDGLFLPMTKMDATGGLVQDTLVADPIDYLCYWFNLPEDEYEGDLLILKYVCPEGTPYGQDKDWYDANCTDGHSGVTFGVTSSDGLILDDTVAGSLVFGDLPHGEIGIQEMIPPGFGEPEVFCGTDGDYAKQDVENGYFSREFAPGANWWMGCYYFNIPAEPGHVTILKWTCPEGYDLFAAGADPQMDCTEATNGVEFQFGLDGGEALAELQATGDIIDGGVFFDDLEPGTYKAVELVPEGIESVFVLECTGHLMGVLQPYPLSQGNVLDSIEVDGGEHLTCHWYNVPESDSGSLTVVKYTCSTEVFVSDVDCEIEEDGITFDLLHWNVGTGTWDVTDTDVTDGFGKIQWIDVEPGDYGLDEHDGEWCHLRSDSLSNDGTWLDVVDGEDTVVEVFNCTGEPGTPGDTPTKYPNTGVQPAESKATGEPAGFLPVSGALPLLMAARRFPSNGPAMHA
jgi:hypothetical protein